MCKCLARSKVWTFHKISYYNTFHVKTTLAGNAYKLLEEALVSVMKPFKFPTFNMFCHSCLAHFLYFQLHCICFGMSFGITFSLLNNLRTVALIFLIHDHFRGCQLKRILSGQNIPRCNLLYIPTVINFVDFVIP